VIRETSDVGYAVFSKDRRFRYTLRRWLTGVEFADDNPRVIRVCFLMLNPSTADAVINDRTVARCIKFATRWGANVLDVVNLFAFRSPYPTELRAVKERGDDLNNDTAILAAATGTYRTIAAWGLHGALADRALYVRRLLAKHNLPLYHLGLTKDGSPTHPIARGKSYIPYDRKPVVWRLEAD